MAKERIVWRPNAIPAEQWDAMSRADQIQWWEDRQELPCPKPHMREAIGLYERGDLTGTEFTVWVMRYACLEEMADFLRECPPELLARITETLTQYGDDETQWPRTYHLACYAPWIAADKIKAAQRREQEEIWNGVRLLKKFFSSLKG
jgi:hypothetical protein